MRNDIRDFYKLKYEKKIFFDKKYDLHKSYYILYLNKFITEKENFINTFVNYLPVYVKSNEYINSIFNSSDINNRLIDNSKKLWFKSKTLQHRSTNMDGLYGELFLDFYSRIVNNERLFITYAAKRSYNSNMENFGYDQLYYSIDKNYNINLVVCESKFVTDKSSCKTDFKDDIYGVKDKKPSHFTQEYFDDYIDFVLDKDSYDNINDKKSKEIIEKFVQGLNEYGEQNLGYLQYLIDNNICIKIVLFGIYKDKNENINEYKDVYDELENDLKIQLMNMGVSNYKIEIVFIPTKNKSLTLKEGIKDYYDTI